MKTIVITGGTGFIGRALVESLAARGDQVTVLTRNPTSAQRRFVQGVTAAKWDPKAPGDWQRVVGGKDAVVHLAGEPAVGQRWSESVKKEILASRVEPAKLLVDAIERAENKPQTFISASGVGYYGDRKEPVDESGDPGDDFLASVTVAWEGAAERAAEFGVRVVCARLGIVLGQGGGALEEMAKPFKAFVGGPIGSGKQMVSWVHLDDVVTIFQRLIDDETLKGPVNVSAPNPVSNSELSKVIGKVLRRPSVLRVPAAALRVRFGEGADPLLTGQPATPQVLLDAGFQWRYPEVGDAVSEALG